MRSEHWIDVFQKLDLCKLRISDLIAAHFDSGIAEEIVGQLNRQDVSRLGEALGLILREKFKVWADRCDESAVMRCEGEDNARWLRQFLGQQFPEIHAGDVQLDGDSHSSFEVRFDDRLTPFQLRAALENCPAIVPMRMFPVSVQEQPHYVVQAWNLASWLEDQGEDVWWTADGDPLLMSRVQLPAPADELAAAIREIDRPLLVADPTKTGSGEELTAAEINRALDRDEWGDRCLFLRWQEGDVDWLLVEDVPMPAAAAHP
jgi:hypothetical protein